LDVGLHPVDGVEFYTAIRQVPGYQAAPAIALTGYGRDADRQRFLEAGFAAVVVKPIVNQASFDVLIDSLLTGSSMQKPDLARRDKSATHSCSSE
jgi:CheY-like chemotaxis protein